ncbi:hypothetical protein LguiB_020677 [Lonicera macranthoides]
MSQLVRNHEFHFHVGEFENTFVSTTTNVATSLIRTGIDLPDQVPAARLPANRTAACQPYGWAPASCTSRTMPSARPSHTCQQHTPAAALANPLYEWLYPYQEHKRPFHVITTISAKMPCQNDHLGNMHKSIRDMIRYNNNNSIITISQQHSYHVSSIMPQFHPTVSTSCKPKTTHLEGSKALIHVSSEWEVAQGLGSPSRLFGDNPQDIFPRITLRIVNEENASYKPHRRFGKNYTRQYPSKVMTISSPTISRDLLRGQGKSSNPKHLVLWEGKIYRVGSPLWETITTGGVIDFIFFVYGLGIFTHGRQ